MPDVVTKRAINRSYLARQLLLDRAEMPIVDAIEHLVGLQAQDVLPPYVALWSRLTNFTPNRLSDLLEQRQAARLTFLRSTVHLTSKRDALRIRPLLQPEIDKAVTGPGPRREAIAGVGLEALADWGRRHLADDGSSMAELRAAAAREWEDRDPRLLAQSAIWLLPATQVPPRGLWQRNDRPRWALADRWLGEAFDVSYPVDELVLRYLRAFGPATSADMRAWSRLTGLRSAIERSRPQLVLMRDEAGRDLLDVPDAPWPDPDTLAPVRFLGGFDNLWLAHKDRSRIVDEQHWPLVMTSNGAGRPTILLDGFLAARYRVTAKKGVAHMEIEPFRRLTTLEISEVEAEGARLLDFLEPELGHDIGLAVASP